MDFMSSALTSGWRSRRYAPTVNNKLGANDSEISKIIDDFGCRCGEFDSMSMWSIKFFFRVFLFLSQPTIILPLPPNSPLILHFSLLMILIRLIHFGFLLHPNPLLHILLIIFIWLPSQSLLSFTLLRFLSFARMNSQNFFIAGLLGSNYKTLIRKIDYFSFPRVRLKDTFYHGPASRNHSSFSWILAYQSPLIAC